MKTGSSDKMQPQQRTKHYAMTAHGEIQQKNQQVYQ